MRMNLLGAAVVAAVFVVAPAGAERFNLVMTGDQEIPGPGDPDGFANGTLIFDKTTNTVSWSFVYGNIAAPTAMHIHTGAAGVAGPVLVNLGVATSGGAGTLISSTPTTMGNVNTILANPPGFYVNIHNAPFPAGAVRGQLVPAPQEEFPVTLSGDEEVPGPGDPDGSASGTVVIDPGTNMIFWAISYENIGEPTGFHIHTGGPGVSGGIFVDLGVATQGGPGTLNDSKSGLTNAVIDALLADPAGYYLNIHTAKFPAGAVRGQLLVVMAKCPGDFNHDGAVDGADLGQLLAVWGTGSEHEDLNQDGVVDGADLGQLLAVWGPCPR